jgi:hypothetical protein
MGQICEPFITLSEIYVLNGTNKEKLKFELIIKGALNK